MAGTRPELSVNAPACIVRQEIVLSRDIRTSSALLSSRTGSKMLNTINQFLPPLTYSGFLPLAAFIFHCDFALLQDN